MRASKTELASEHGEKKKKGTWASQIDNINLRSHSDHMIHALPPSPSLILSPCIPTVARSKNLNFSPGSP